jgi:hypothetical protein
VGASLFLLPVLCPPDSFHARGWARCCWFVDCFRRSLPADLLYRDYQTDHKFTLTTYTSNGVVSAPLPLRPAPLPSLPLFWVLDGPCAVLWSGGLRFECVGLMKPCGVGS